MTPHSWLLSPKQTRDNLGRQLTPEELKSAPAFKRCQHCGMQAMQWTGSNSSVSYRIEDVARAMVTRGNPGVAPQSTVFEHCEEEEVWKVMMS